MRLLAWLAVVTTGMFGCVRASMEWGAVSPAGSEPKSAADVLDQSFGTRGYVVIAIGSNFQAKALGLQADGKIVVAGDGFVSPANFVVARFDTSGALDASFGTGGVAQVDPSFVEGGAQFDETPAALAISPTSGEIFVAGTGRASIAANIDFTYAAFTPSGILDGSFSSNGVTYVTCGAVDDVVSSLGFQSLGAEFLVTAGTTITGQTPPGFGILRLGASTGVLDSSFNQGAGRQIVELADAVAKGMLVDASNRILVFGYSRLFGSLTSDATVVRLLDDGKLDPSFSSDGKSAIDMGVSDGANTLLQLGNDIVLGGKAMSGTQEVFGLGRLDQGGAPLLSFGTAGVVRTAMSAGNDRVVSVLASGEKLIAVGGAADKTLVALARYDPNGVLDTSFGTGGRLVFSVAEGPVEVVAGALDSAGRVLILGILTQNDAKRLFLARYAP